MAAGWREPSHFGQPDYPFSAVAAACASALSGEPSLEAAPGYDILGKMKGKSSRAVTLSSHTIPIVPRYAETDRGGVIHHSVFPVWFEMGRTELLRANGIVYKDLEAEGIFFVVAELRIKYRRPVFYDEALRLETTCSKVGAAKVEHTYRLLRGENGLVLTEGSSVLACVGADGKVRRVPEFMCPQEQ
jgi:acyl-CoA thioester hydrolase